MEDLKARYYAIARQLAADRRGGQEAAQNLTIIKHPYNADHERYG
jgi:DNA methyltransferase 1-associated protein 1